MKKNGSAPEENKVRLLSRSTFDGTELHVWKSVSEAEQITHGKRCADGYEYYPVKR